MNSQFSRKRIRARKDASDSGSPTDLESTSDDSDNASLDSQGEGTSDVDSRESSSEKSDQPSINEAASISFGALAKVQEVLGKRKRGDTNDESDSPDSRRNMKADTSYVDSEAFERKAGKKDARHFSRTSKHAPTELSYKKAVTRKREIVPTQKINYRDPRFEPLSGPLDELKAKKKYAFLDIYRDSEMDELKSAIRKTKDPEAKEKLQRALLSMESRKKSQQAKDQQQEVIRKHRKEEKAKVEQGKRPFYLKKADQKQLALVERFEGMKGKQVDKVIERRRKKQAGKERKSMPDTRRG